MDLKEIMKKSNDYDQLLISTKGYAFDSLIYRFKDYQAKAFNIEVADYKYSHCCQEIEARKKVRDRHNRDLMRFIQILDSVIGEHD